MSFSPPMNGTFADDDMIEYFKQGMIHENTPAWDDVMNILKQRNLSFTRISPNHTPQIIPN
ncbi:hypothetical protein PCURB6_27400 [Paenibacillus curdlanolyticus]|nr:hypothetical protein PCURB6_27400 [Paenibacillus curdlanolyticus]